MKPVAVHLEGDGVWPDMNGAQEGELEGICALERGTKEGRPSIGLRIRLANGDLLLVQTTARIFCVAARAIETRYPGLEPSSVQ